MLWWWGGGGIEKNSGNRFVILHNCVAVGCSLIPGGFFTKGSML